jgi:hypothetical protein
VVVVQTLTLFGLHHSSNHFACGRYGIMLRRFCGEIHANALVVSFYRDALAFPVLIAAARFFEGPLKLPRRRRDLVLFCGLGLTGMFGGQLFYILGVFYAGPDVASVVQPVRTPHPAHPRVTRTPTDRFAPCDLVSLPMALLHSRPLSPVV